MLNRIVPAVLTIVLCATLALGGEQFAVSKSGVCLAGPVSTLDDSVAIIRPGANESPGNVPVVIMLTNVGDVAALVPRLDVTIKPSGYADNKQNISVPVGVPATLTMTAWTAPASGTETCMAWITDPADANHTNDTVVLLVHCGLPGLSGEVGMPPSRSASLLTSSIAHTRCGVNHVGLANVTLYDIRGRVAARYSLGVKESSLDLRSLSAGVYLVRLGDGRSAVTQKLVVQR
ncbi:MAG TPA: T9SS type A sorting domain-containing protein [bacterium]|nr:T9SS type A sorting domain-containing protein [bacterium]